jgi:mono/diheme cytochrome c family protein
MGIKMAKGGKKMQVALFLLIILAIFTSGCFEEPVGEIVYIDYVAPTLPPKVGPGPGQGIYNTNCAGCHAMGGQGALPGTPDFTSAAYWDSKSDEDVLTAIKVGVEGTQMPGWEGKISDSEIDDVLVYMKSFAGR